MGSVEISLNNNGQDFLKTDLKDMLLAVIAKKYIFLCDMIVTSRDSSADIRGSLSDLTMTFLGQEEWIQILGRTDKVTSEPLLEFRVSTLVGDPQLAAKLELRMASVTIRYYHRAILECVCWGENLDLMAQSRSLVSGVVRPRNTGSTSTVNGDGVIFSVHIDNPYVIIPQDSSQSVVGGNQMEVDLGTIVIDNKMVTLQKAIRTRRESQNKRKNLVDLAVAQSRERKGEVAPPIASVRSRRVVDGKVTKGTDQKASQIFPVSTNSPSLDLAESEGDLQDVENGSLLVNRIRVAVSEFTVSVQCDRKTIPFVKKTGASFLVDLPVDDKGHTLPDATVIQLQCCRFTHIGRNKIRRYQY